MKKRSNLNIMLRLIGLVKPLTGFMILAILMGLIGHLCASFITIFGGYAVLSLVGEPVFPIFADDDLVARGVHMQAESIEDEGAGVQFNVFVFNVQPGVEIDYATGESRAIETEEEPEQPQTEGKIRGNRRSKIYHCPGQAAYEDMADSDNLILFDTTTGQRQC